jgi:sulfatase modifying factor 1
MKTKLGLLLLMLLIAVGCDDSTQTEQAAEIAKLQEQVQNLQKITADKAATKKAVEEKAAADKAALEKAAADKAAADKAAMEKAALDKAALDKAALDKAAILSGHVITNGIGMTLNLIPAGTFMMGSPETEKNRGDDEYQHKVTISKAFYMQTTEITQGQWKALMGTKPWKGHDGNSNDVKEGANYPAVYISWNDAIAFCENLIAEEGRQYRLPTEAEWEYACRAGTETRWSFGDDEKVLGDYAWYDNNTRDYGQRYAHQVGLKKPNAFGLFDMHGNVWEHCRDYFGEDYYEQSPEKDPTGPASGSLRVVRSLGSVFDERQPRNALRDATDGSSRNINFGFRLVRELD